MNEIHHLGIVSDNLNTALKSLDIDKSEIIETIDDEIQNNFIYIIKNSPWIEIIIPKNSKSTVKNFTKKNQVGIHHIGFLCDSINKIESSIKSDLETVKIGKYMIHVNSFGGKILTLFLHKNNLIIEYVEIQNAS